MILITAFLLELLILFLLARSLTLHLSLLLYKLGMGESLVMHLLAILFLPGTFIHEVSHYLMSVLLRVRVYSMTLIPKPVAGGYIKMGGIEHVKVDLLRSLLIGSAPFIIGSLLLFILLYYCTSYNPFGLNWTTVLIGLVVFQIGNTMFSSKKDMEGSFKFLLILGFVFGVAYLLGWRISWEQLDQSIPGSIINLFKQADLFLLIPLSIDALVLVILLLLNKIRA